jgi:hypothetical protein
MAAMTTVLLTDPPVRFIDPKAVGETAVYYRAVEEESYQAREFTWGNITLVDFPE